MKKITLLSAVLLTLNCFAQSTYTSADFAQPGEEFTISSASNFAGMNFAATGANHNWNYSTLVADSQTTGGWQNPNGAGYKTSWCFAHFYFFNCNSQFNANFSHSAVIAEGMNLMNYGIENIVEHSKVATTGFSNKMRGLTATINGLSVPVTVDYDDPDEVYQFPMAYNDTFSSTGHLSLDLNSMGMPFSYTLETQRTNTVQGWGTLATPFATFNNVLKLKTVLEKTETIVYNGTTLPIPSTTVSYQWFSPDYGRPVLQVEGYEVFNFFIPTSVTYIDQPLCLAADAQFAYLPVGDYNPDSQSATVPFINLSNNYSSVSWDFGDGETATEATPSHIYTCPGTYQVSLTVTNSACMPSTTDTFTLPVVVTDSQNALTTEVILGDASLLAVRDLPGTTYQWVDCNNGNAIIDGETNQVFHPTVGGNYACILNTNGCEAVSDCVVYEILATTHFDDGAFELYPNPTNGELKMSFNNLNVTDITIYNMLGMEVGKQLNLSGQQAGIYFVKITAKEGTYLRKIVKQ